MLLLSSRPSVEKLDEALSEFKCNIYISQQYGMKAILWAAWFGHLPVIEFLVGIGAKTKDTNKVKAGEDNDFSFLIKGIIYASKSNEFQMEFLLF